MENTVVVLSDGDTFDGVDSTYIYIVNENGNKDLENNGSFNSVEDQDILEYVCLRDLLDCWNAKYGTSF